MAWMHYNPHRADPAVLDAITGGASRLALLDELLRVLHAEPGRPNHQHQLLIGPRGAGKTHLMRVLVHRLRKDPALAAAWWPVVLPEEVALRGPIDLLARVVERLDRELADAGQAAARTPLLEAQVALKGMRRGPEALEVADAALAKASAALGRALVVVVENLDGVLYVGPGGSRGRAADEQWALRRQLQSAPHLLLLGAAPTHFGAASDTGAAFYGFFREHAVEGLPTVEVLAILEHRLATEAEGESDRARRARELVARMPERRGKLAGILRLTGGLPRFVHLVVDLLLDSEDGEVGDLMDRLLDEQTPLFQSRLDPRLVAPQELEALAELARAEGPLRPAELARRVSVSGAEASVLLERLRERGLARRSGRVGNAATWDVGEPLYRVWMAFREGGEPRSRIEALAGVVAALWDQEDLEKRRAEAEETGNVGRAELFGAALRFGVVLPLEAEVEPGEWEKAYAAAKERWEKTGSGEDALDLAQAAYMTGRYGEATVRAEHALLSIGDEEPLRADALFIVGMLRPHTGNPSTGELQLAEAADLTARAGDANRAGWCHLAHANALRQEGQREQRRAALDAAEASWGDAATPHARAAVAIQRSDLSPAHARDLLESARTLDPQGVNGALAGTKLGLLLARHGEPARPLLAESVAVFERLGLHDLQANGQAYLARDAARASALHSAADCWFQGIDAVKGTGVSSGRCAPDLAWLVLRAAATGDLPLAARALRVLASAVSDEDAPDAQAEAALLDAAVHLLARRPPAEAHELLYGACGDLTRARRALLEPFVLAARCLEEPRETVLLEEPEEMRRVVDDVLARVARLKSGPERQPGWFTTGDLSAN